MTIDYTARELLNKLAFEARLSRTRADRNTSNLNEDVAALADLVAGHSLLLAALMKYLDEKGSVETTRFMEIMTEIDASDGVIDGKKVEHKLRTGSQAVHLPKKRK